jgi:hypothetical protein
LNRRTDCGTILALERWKGIVMGTDSEPRRAHAGLSTVLAAAVVAILTFGCASTQIVGVGPAGTPASNNQPIDEPIDYPVDTPRTGPAPGTWTGTITVRGVIDVDKSDSGDNDQDPNSAYYQTYTRTKTNQTDVTDTFTIEAEDPESLAYGINAIDFDGEPGQNTGSSDQSEIYHWDKQNSGCTWKEENGTEMSGSWNGTGELGGSLEFQEDGSYLASLQVTPNGDLPSLQMHSWLENSDISANCEEVEPGYDNTEEAGPPFTWATENYGDTTTDGGSVLIEGTIAPNATVVDGTGTWEIGGQGFLPDSEVEPITMTITWHLAHSGPITLPHD